MNFNACIPRTHFRGPLTRPNHRVDLMMQVPMSNHMSIELSSLVQYKIKNNYNQNKFIKLYNKYKFIFILSKNLYIFICIENLTKCDYIIVAFFSFKYYDITVFPSYYIVHISYTGLEKKY